MKKEKQIAEKKEVIRQTDLIAMTQGELKAYPIGRYGTLNTLLYIVRKCHPDRKYIMRAGEDTVYVIRDK